MNISGRPPRLVPSVFHSLDGIHHARHRKRAIAIGQKIGLYRDWPVAQGCTPPYVPVWIEAMGKRQG